jgi:hypothetical protein
LAYFKNINNYIPKPSFAFEISSVTALAPAPDFMQQNFSSVDSSSHLLRSLLLFQQLLRFHAKDTDPAAFIDADLERIEWVNENAVMEEKDSLYSLALQYITSSYADNIVAAQAWYLLAKIDADNAATYNPFGDTTHRYDYAKSKKTYRRKIKKQPAKSEGNSNMQQLLKEITKKVLHTQVESVNIPATHSVCMCNTGMSIRCISVL